MLQKKNLFALPMSIAMLAVMTTSVFAHAVVKPNQVGIGAFQDFTLGVPSEKDADTTGVRLLLPNGVTSVSPVVKPGWKITVKSGPIPAGVKAPVAADGDVATSIPSEIDWTGGTIPTGQKDLFVFSAQVPSQAATLNWKVYQQYSDGSTVSWDQDPKAPQPKTSSGAADFSAVGPYSTTAIVNDLTSPASDKGMPMGQSSNAQATANDATMWVAYIALLAAIIALALSLKPMVMKKNQPMQ